MSSCFHKCSRRVIIGMTFGLLVATAAHAGQLEGLSVIPTKDPNYFKLIYQPHGDKDPIKGVVAYPKGIGPFRVVIVNHGPDGDALKVAYNYFPHFLDRGYAAIGFDLTYAKNPEESDAKENIRRLSAFLDVIKNDEKLDNKNIFIFGNGWGAMMTTLFATQTDQLRAIGMTGGGRVPKEPLDFDKIAAPVILVHGAKDQSVPLESAMKLKSNLERAGKKVEIKVIEQSGHEVVVFKASDVFDAVVSFFNKQAK